MRGTSWDYQWEKARTIVGSQKLEAHHCWLDVAIRGSEYSVLVREDLGQFLLLPILGP
jgi:hypothetical protein